MRRVTFLMLILTIVACSCLGIACATDVTDMPEECAHTGGTATCLSKAVCELCGEEYGELNAENHASTENKFVSNGDGTHNKVRSCCNALIEANVACSGGEATECGAKNVCIDCGGEYGEALEHDFADTWSTDGEKHWHACTREGCTAKSEESEHTGGTATCLSEAVCDTCKQPYGNTADHVYGEWQHDGDKHWKECTTEGCTAKSEEGEHTGGTATCLSKAVCSTCSKEYGNTADHVYGEWQHDDDKHWKECTTEGCTAKSEEGEHNFDLWDKSADDYDYKACKCGVTDTTQSFDKTVSLINQTISLFKSAPYSINIGGVDEYASVEKIALGDYNFGTVLTALEISENFKADTRMHGKQTLIVTVNGEDGATHEIKVPVTFITAEIEDSGDLRAIQPTATQKGVYGYYVLTSDISDNTLNANAYVSKDWEETNGFFGTLDGQGHTVSMAANGANGLFGILRGATIKNLTIEDNWRSAYISYALLAKATFNSTLENVTFTYKEGNTQATVGDGYGWISYAEFSGNTLKDVTVNDSQGYGSLFGFKFYNNTFDNVTINGTYAEMGHTADEKDKEGNIVKAGKAVLFDDVTKIVTTKVTLEGRQDFVLDGAVSVIDLGDYSGSKILSITTSTGFDLASLSSEYVDSAFKAARQKHGEQNINVTLIYNNETVVVVVPVTVITKSIKTMSELQDAVKHTTDSDLYGYYVLANDVTVNETGYVAKDATYAWNSGTGFKGTLDGRGKTITMQGNKSKHGLFGTLNGATIKNVTINNAWYNGWSASVLGYTAYNTTFENITINVSGNTVEKKDDTTKIGVIVGAETGGCSWKNVTINVANAQYTLFHTMKKDGKTDRFENVKVVIPTLTQFSDNGQPTGVTVSAS